MEFKPSNLKRMQDSNLFDEKLAKKSRISLEKVNVVMDAITKNPGLQHISQDIFNLLDKKSILDCRLVNHAWKNILDEPTFWLKKMKDNEDDDNEDDDNEDDEYDGDDEDENGKVD